MFEKIERMWLTTRFVTTASFYIIMIVGLVGTHMVIEGVKKRRMNIDASSDA